MSTPADSPTVFGREVLARFARKQPLAMTLRLAMEHLFAASELDAIFERCRVLGYTRTLAFAALVEVMTAVVLGTFKSVNAVVTAWAGRLPVRGTSIYNKLNGLEAVVSAGLVAHTAPRARAMIEAARGTCAPLLPHRRVRILDGNHLAATERRLEVLWGCAAGPLPGFCLVVLDPLVRLFTDVIPCEDGHAQERGLTDEILALVRAADCWIADRNFCTQAILFGLLDRGADFVIRQHGKLAYRRVGVRHARGRVATGAVYEQDVELPGATACHTLRRVTVVLDTPTRDGDTEVHLLTSLAGPGATDVPAAERVTAGTAADLYLARWGIESAFAELARCLQAEVAPLGYPRAALFGFCVGLTAYNALSMVLGALRAVHGEQVIAEEVSSYHIVQQARLEVTALDTLLEERDWTPMRRLTTVQIAAEMVRLAGTVSLRTIRKAKRGPKKLVPARTRFKQTPHVSTKRLLDAKTEVDS
jgi:hypothetical protein